MHVLKLQESFLPDQNSVRVGRTEETYAHIDAGTWGLKEKRGTEFSQEQVLVTITPRRGEGTCNTAWQEA